MSLSHKLPLVHLRELLVVVVTELGWVYHGLPEKFTADDLGMSRIAPTFSQRFIVTVDWTCHVEKAIA